MADDGAVVPGPDQQAVALADDGFWGGTIAALVTAAAPGRILELGTETGGHTRLLLNYCRQTGAQLDLADIRGDAALSALLAQHAAWHRFHPFSALQALPLLPPCDMAVLDSDPNWYTVFHALQLLFARAVEGGRPAPIAVLHGAGWPNARRDSYRDPGRIPERHAHAQRGIVPGCAELRDDGVEGTRWHALMEGGPLNGVLTAAEDFVASWSDPVGLHVLPMMGGLAILVPAARRHAAVAAALEDIFAGPHLLRLCTGVDEARTRLAAELAARSLALSRRTHALASARSVIARLSGAPDDPSLR